MTQAEKQMQRDDFARYGDVNGARLLYASLDEDFARRDGVIANVGTRAPFAFVRAIDGRGWDEAQTESVMSEAMRDRRRNELAKGRDWLTRGAIAAAMTHRSNMIGAIRSEGKFCCEDDAAIDGPALDLIRSGELGAVLDRLDGVTLLHYRSWTDIVAEAEPVARVGRYAVHRVKPQGIGSAACYFMPASIAPRVVQLQTPISVPADVWDDMITGGAFPNLYVLHPRPARVGDYPTTIGYAYAEGGGTLRRLASRVKALRRVKHWLSSLRGDFSEKVTRWVDKF
jgi:hypothetical protein